MGFKGTLLTFCLGGIAMLYVASKTKKKKSIIMNTEHDKNESVPSPSPDAYFASFPGWRRALNAEVGPGVLADAVGALHNPLKTIIDRENYRLVLETHYSPEKGEHKGVTVFKRLE